MADVLTVVDVQQVALGCGLREVMCVPPLHGYWWARGVDVRCSSQGWGLSIGVLATVPDGPSDVWRWRSNHSAGIPADVLAVEIERARATAAEQVAS